jgi:hypothetical protein
MFCLVQIKNPVLRVVKSVPKWNGKVVVAFFSNKKDDDKKEPKTNSAWNVLSSVRHLTERNTKVVAIGGGVLVALGISRGLYGLTHSFLTMTPYNALYYGFVGGMLATGTVATMVHFSERAFHINPDRAVHASMGLLRKNSDLRAILGNSYHSGPIRTYQSTQGGFGIRKNFPQWVHPEIQVAFPVQGSSCEALVTAVYTKKGVFGKEILLYVGLEYVDGTTGNPVTLTLKGDDDKFEVRSQIKAHATSLVKKYFK